MLSMIVFYIAEIALAILAYQAGKYLLCQPIENVLVKIDLELVMIACVTALYCISGDK